MSTYDRPATDRQPLFFRTTRCNKPFERPANTLSQILQLITSAHRLHIFGIRRFDNMNYLKVYKRISVRKICIEIDQLPMESSTCWPYLSPSYPFHSLQPNFAAFSSDLICQQRGSKFRRKKFGNLLHIYLDFLKTSYASNYFWDSEYFWDIFIRYFLNFFYGPHLSPSTRPLDNGRH